MQSAWIGSLMELAGLDGKICYLTADSGEGGLDLMFRRNFPDRAFNFGIAEENMVGAAAGLAASGKTPFVYAAAPFLLYRAYEFIRDDVCLQELNVKLVGSGSGLSVSTLGPTHHTTEDIALLHSLPNLTVLSPGSPIQAYEAVKVANEVSGPVYIRLGLNREKEFFDETYQMDIYAVDNIRDGGDVNIFVTGAILEEAVEAAEMLGKEGIAAAVTHIHTVKPFRNPGLISRMREAKVVCTVEEHNVLGGLGSMVCDLAASEGIGARIVKIGLDDCFASGYGRLRQLRKENGLDADTICRRIRMELA